MSIFTGTTLTTPAVSTTAMNLPALPAIYPLLSSTTISVTTLAAFTSIEPVNTLSSFNIGQNAGISSQTTGAYHVNIGPGAGERHQSDFCVSIGYRAGFSSQFTSSLAIGAFAGVNNQRGSATAVGFQAGSTVQGAYGVAVGTRAGANANSIFHVLVGNQAGLTGSGNQAINIGNQTGQTNSGFRSLAIGSQAALTGQGQYCVALGYQAGLTNQYQSSIVLNAWSTGITAISSSLYINPIRNAETAIINPLHYLSTQSEITYNPAIGLSSANISSLSASNISANLILANTAVGINLTPAIGNQLELSTDNAIQATQTLWKTASDSRIKQNIVSASIETCDSIIRQLQLYRYELLVSSPDTHVLGLIAQNVQNILPKSIRSTNMHGIDDFLCIDYDQIYKMQIGATQYLIKRIETIEQRIENLKIRALTYVKPVRIITPFG